MRIKWYASDSHACGHVRGEIIARVINKMYSPHVVDIKTSISLSDYYSSDVMIFQRQHDATVLEKMRLAKEMNIPTVYEIDDDFFNTPQEFEGPWKFYSNPEVQKVIRTFLNEVDAVVVSTPTLKKAIAGITARPIHVVENALDVDFWAREKPLNEKPVIGWMASGSHTIDAPLVTAPVVRLMEEREDLKLLTIGLMGPKDMPGIEKFGERTMIMEWQMQEVLPDRLRHLDIGLAPLKAHPYNDSKSHIKALQYWANKTPVVCSPSPAYNDLVIDGENGVMAETEDDWYKGISRLLDDREERDRLGANGYKLLTEKYDIRNFANNWLNLFSSLLSTKV
jgi:glycosyltransferase involved in cell wall biosynthesis